MIFYEKTREVMEITAAQLKEAVEEGEMKGKVPYFVKKQKALENAVPGRKGGLVDMNGKLLLFTSHCELFVVDDPQYGPATVPSAASLVSDSDPWLLATFSHSERSPMKRTRRTSRTRRAMTPFRSRSRRLP